MFEEIKPLVNENIKRAIEANTLNAKVMPGDHLVSAEERERYVFQYDINKRKLSSKMKRAIATRFANKKTKSFAKHIKIEGFENTLPLKGKGCIITANHYSPFDSSIIRYLTDKLGFKNKLAIVINETNLFMKGSIGQIVRNLDVLPYAQDMNYLGKKFNPALSKRLAKNEAIIVYPEQEMWLDYPYPRPLMPGAYHFATKFNVPILPLFTTWDKDKEGNTIYTIHVGKILYPSSSESLSENKKRLINEDTSFRKTIAQRIL